MQRRPRSSPWIFVGLTALLGCTGAIGGGSSSDPPAPPPADTPGGPPGTAPPGPSGPVDPGRVTLHRLTRREYNNTVRDLLGTKLRPADDFASDPAGFGYDNNSDVQSLPPLQIDQYIAAAETLADEALAGGVAPFAARAGIPACDLATDAACQWKIVRAFSRRAFRRPVADREVARLLEIGTAAKAQGEDALGQLRLIVRAILSSPHFLFRVEVDPDPLSLLPHLLTSHEVSSRLSYFLWSSMPDAALFESADRARMVTDAEVRAQATRMLGDPRAASLVDSFGAQWLSLAALEQHEVDGKQFAFDKSFGLLIRDETLAFFREFLAKDLPVAELLRAPFTFLNDRLAAHYGLPPVGSATLTRVALTGDRRRGLLTQAAILTRTSFPARTSPTVRGAWISTHLLCSPPPPPPPNVPPFPEAAAGATGSVRQRLEAHRANPACAACHAPIDPIGFGLENYDLVGRYRTTDRGVPIDATGALPGGATFNGAAQLTALLAADPRLTACLGRNLMTYALGRGLDPSDEPSLAEAVGRATGGGLRALILEVAGSAPFRMRRGEPAGGAKP